MKTALVCCNRSSAIVICLIGKNGYILVFRLVVSRISAGNNLYIKCPKGANPQTI